MPSMSRPVDPPPPGMGNARFGDLNVGDRFCFVGSPDVLVKTSRGWYTRMGDNRRFHTGARTGVEPVPKTQAPTLRDT
jgi:hypothetical protein